ncbi:MAG: aldehyde dehydrogenase family protein [Thiolinea sp.]
MLFGAMELLQLSDPWQLDTDIGPVIDAAAAQRINDYVQDHQAKVLKQLAVPA